MRIVSRSVLPVLVLFLFVLAIAPATAGDWTIPLGEFQFDSRLFGDTAIPVPDSTLPESPKTWLNVVNSDPGWPGRITGPNFTTGMFNIEHGGPTIGYTTPIVNGPGYDLGVVRARGGSGGAFTAFSMAISTDGVNFVTRLPIELNSFASQAIPTGVTYSYFTGLSPDMLGYPGPGPFLFGLYVTPVDFSQFGLAEGTSVQAISLQSHGDPFLHIIRVAGFDRGDSASVAVPELAILHILGPQLNALLNPSLQHVTAWGATAILRAIRIPAVQRGVYVDLPSVSLEVQEWCSGLYSMKWLLLLALFIALVGSRSLPWKIALIVVAPLIALEANMLRVAGIGVSLELVGRHDYYGYKDWIGWATLALGAVQVIGLGRLMNRRARTA